MGLVAPCISVGDNRAWAWACLAWGVPVRPPIEPGDRSLSPPIIDERRMKHERAASAEAGGESRPREPVQFTLRGLLSFFTAMTVCLSLVISGLRVHHIMPGAEKLLFGLATVLAYFFLSVTYRRLRLTVARIAHWCGMGFGVLLAYPTLAARTVDDLQSGVFLPASCLVLSVSRFSAAATVACYSVCRCSW